MTIQEGQSYYIDQFFQRLGDDTATLAWKGALEASITNNSGNWVPLSTLFQLWKFTVEGWEDFVDQGDLMKSSDSLKKFLGRNPKTMGVLVLKQGDKDGESSHPGKEEPHQYGK